MDKLIPKEYLTIEQLAKEMGVSRATINRWIWQNKLKTRKRFGGTYYYKLADVKRDIKEFFKAMEES